MGFPFVKDLVMPNKKHNQVNILNKEIRNVVVIFIRFIYRSTNNITPVCTSCSKS